ncbi:MAG: creatininase family protein [Pseudomonadota bacterium]
MYKNKKFAAYLLGLVGLALLSAFVGAENPTGPSATPADNHADGSTPVSYWTEQLTSAELAGLISSGMTTVIVPTGGIEENGPYLTTGKHNVILDVTCPEIARVLRNALCAPIVKFVPEGNIDPPSGAMKYPGTISLRQETYKALLTDICASLRQAGFRDIVLIGDSGGNQDGMKQVAEALETAWSGTETRIHFIADYYDPGWEATENYTERELGVRETQSDGFHDDIWVTAMMMVKDPELVRYSLRERSGTASINGVSIAPADKTIALGKKMIRFRAELTAEAINRALGKK